MLRDYLSYSENTTTYMENYMTLKEKVDTLIWWHRIRLTDEILTPGLSDHSSDNLEQVEKRFGITKELVQGKSVLDVGCWDGLFSFEAEKRGAIEITAIDAQQNIAYKEGQSFGADKCFQLAKEALGSNAVYDKSTLLDFTTKPHDVVLFLGVLYHLENPLENLKKLALLTKEVAIIETAISLKSNEVAMYEFNAGFENDTTNTFYPNYKGLEQSLLWSGFKKVEKIYDMGSRITVKAWK